jgi:hypothetical protein
VRRQITEETEKPTDIRYYKLADKVRKRAAEMGDTGVAQTPLGDLAEAMKEFVHDRDLNPELAGRARFAWAIQGKAAELGIDDVAKLDPRIIVALLKVIERM